MSNRGPSLFSKSRGFVLGLSVGLSAYAQSPELIDAVRMHRPEATQRAKDELELCRTPSSDRLPDGGALLPCAQERRLALLVGFLTLSDGEAAEAAKVLAKARAPAGLEAFHDYYLAEAQAWSGSRAQAVKTFARAKKAAPAWLAQRIDVRVAELELDLGHAEKARPVLESAADADPSPENLLTRALARLGTGDVEAGRADLRQIVLRFPAHPHAQLAKSALERTGAPVSFTPEERLFRAQALTSAGDASAALLELEEVELPGKSGAARVALARAQALLAKGKDAEAQAQIDLALTGGPSVAAEALLARARRLMRLTDHAGARVAFREVDRKFLDQPGSDEAGYFAAWLSLPMGEFDAAVKGFSEFEERHPGSRRRDEARWFRAWALFRQERFFECREVLSSLASDFPRSALVPQARYWAARAAQLRTEPSDAGVKVDVAAEYRSVIRDFPGAFYALLASERLRDLSVEPPLPFPARPKEQKPKPPKALGLAVKLSEAGLLRDASEEIQRAVAGIGSQEEALAYGHALQGLGEFGAAYSVAARHLWGAAYTAKQPEAIALLYPRAYREPVEQACQEVGLDPFLAWAIMRRESAFRADVVSAADARGLMQIIPPTARSIAEKLKEPSPAADDLYSPSLNLRFGTWYLSALMERLGHPALCAAGYNAGPNAVVRWAEKKAERPLDEWIEEIPYKETRGYVKQVVGDYYLYQQLYGDGPVGRLPLTLPAPKPTGVTF